MKKQFANIEELRIYGAKWNEEHGVTFEDMVLGTDGGYKMADDLVSNGYDLDDLTADGHDYQIAGHTNNGWVYRDECCEDCIENREKQGRIRNR